MKNIDKFTLTIIDSTSFYTKNTTQFATRQYKLKIKEVKIMFVCFLDLRPLIDKQMLMNTPTVSIFQQ